MRDLHVLVLALPGGLRVPPDWEGWGAIGGGLCPSVSALHGSNGAALEEGAKGHQVPAWGRGRREQRGHKG